MTYRFLKIHLFNIDYDLFGVEQEKTGKRYMESNFKSYFRWVISALLERLSR